MPRKRGKAVPAALPVKEEVSTAVEDVPAALTEEIVSTTEEMETDADKLVSAQDAVPDDVGEGEKQAASEQETAVEVITKQMRVYEELSKTAEALKPNQDKPPAAPPGPKVIVKSANHPTIVIFAQPPNVVMPPKGKLPLRRLPVKGKSQLNGQSTFKSPVNVIMNKSPEKTTNESSKNKSLEKSSRRSVKSLPREMCCPYCPEKFITLQSLSMHKNKAHHEELMKEETKDFEKGAFKCPYCPARFVGRTGIYKHKLNKHPEERKQEVGRNTVKCNQCETFRCRTTKDLIQHLNTSHNYKLEVKKESFSSWKEFDEWKSKMEQAHKTSFVVNGGVRKGDKNARYMYYCNRTGRYVKRATLGKRRTKSKGSSKLSGHCSAFLNATTYKDTPRVDVQYCIQHLHETELSHLRISSALRKCIVEKLSHGAEIHEVLKDVHVHLAQVDDRAKLVTIKDIKNIKAQYKISENLIGIKKATLELIPKLAWAVESTAAAVESSTDCIALHRAFTNLNAALVSITDIGIVGNQQ